MSTRRRPAKSSLRSGSEPPFERGTFRKKSLELEFHDGGQPMNAVRTPPAAGISTQFVTVAPGAAYDFKWTGASHFLAFHQLRMSDGETLADDVDAVRRKDARSTFTFIPAGCRVWGWTEIAGRDNAFLALYLEPESLRQELDARLTEIEMKPRLFFAAPEIVVPVAKLQAALSSSEEIDPLYVETLSLLVATEFCRHHERHVAGRAVSGRIGTATIDRVEDFIRSKIGEPITLEDLARLSGLSRFHFLRAFKATTGETPYQRVVRLRIDRARELLREKPQSVGEVARRVGYASTSRFIEAFRRVCGMTPGEFVTQFRTPASRHPR